MVEQQVADATDFIIGITAIAFVVVAIICIVLYFIIRAVDLDRLTKKKHIFKTIGKSIFCLFWGYFFGGLSFSTIITYTHLGSVPIMVLGNITYILYAIALIFLVVFGKKRLSTVIYWFFVNISFFIIPLIFAVIGDNITWSQYIITEGAYTDAFEIIAIGIGFALCIIFSIISLIVYNLYLVLRYFLVERPQKKVVDICVKTKFSPNTENNPN